MDPAQIVRLPDGRLHLQHGPIDIIADAEGPGREQALARAEERFKTVLTELVADLPELRKPVAGDPMINGVIAGRMLDATRPFAPAFITPMASVAGAVADEICGEMVSVRDIEKAYVNNGGDVAFHLSPGQTTTAAIAGTATRVTIPDDVPVRGMATSGWRGRSHSMGIADSVTVLAASAAMADAAATMIANAVDLPGHPGISRQKACDLFPDSDLGDQLVTTAVPALTQAEINEALDAGLRQAEAYRRRGLISAAYLVLQGSTRAAGADTLIPAPHP